MAKAWIWNCCLKYLQHRSCHKIFFLRASLPGRMPLNMSPLTKYHPCPGCCVWCSKIMSQPDTWLLSQVASEVWGYVFVRPNSIWALQAFNKLRLVVINISLCMWWFLQMKKQHVQSVRSPPMEKQSKWYKSTLTLACVPSLSPTRKPQVYDSYCLWH